MRHPAGLWGPSPFSSTGGSVANIRKNGLTFFLAASGKPQAVEWPAGDVWQASQPTCHGRANHEDSRQDQRIPPSACE